MRVVAAPSDTAAAVGEIGAAFYVTEETRARGLELGLDGFRFYFLGRGGVLGDVEWVVVHSAFGYFEPGLVERTWRTARQRASAGPRQVGRDLLECAHRFGRERFSGLDLERWCAAAAAVVGAADPTGLALFAGVAGEPAPDDVGGRAMHLAVQLRELRGSAHLLAVRAVGLEPRVAHFLRRPDYYTGFGWPEGSEPEVGDADRARLAEADVLTDRLLAPAYGVLDDAAARAFADGVAVMRASVTPAG